MSCRCRPLGAVQGVARVYHRAYTNGRGNIPRATWTDKLPGALNTIHRRRDLLADVYLGAVAVIVRLQLTGTLRFADNADEYQYFAGYEITKAEE